MVIKNDKEGLEVRGSCTHVQEEVDVSIPDMTGRREETTSVFPELTERSEKVKMSFEYKP